MGKFALDVKRYAEAIGEDMDKVIRGTALTLFSDIIKTTPADTGRLKGNWFVTINNPSTKITNLKDKTGSVTIAKAEAKLSKPTEAANFWLTNNLPYAYRIEFEGWSKVKAPAGMVAVNVNRFNAIFEREIKKVRK